MNEITEEINKAMVKFSNLTFPEILGMLFEMYDEDLFGMTNLEFVGALDGLQQIY